MKRKLTTYLSILLFGLSLQGCATHRKEVAIATLVGGGLGAGAGYLFVHHGDHRQYTTRNTIITSAVFALLSAGLVAYHYRSLDDQRVEIASKFSRYTLCNSKGEQNQSCMNEFKLNGQDESKRIIPPSEVGKYSLKLDDDTRWVFPSFQKRFLLPEKSQDSLISSHYKWEIVRPGFFVTKEQNPEYFKFSNEKEKSK